MPEAKVIDPVRRAALERRMQERRWLLAATVLLLAAYAVTYHAVTRSFGETRSLLAAAAVVDVSAVESSQALRPVLATVFEDPQDLDLAAEHVYDYVLQRRSRGLIQQSLPNVGVLNTSALYVDARRAEKGGTVFRQRLAASRRRLGMDPSGNPIVTASDSSAIGRGAHHVAGTVYGLDGLPAARIPVVLGGSRADVVKTDAAGRYRFDGLPAGGRVEVRPVRKYLAFPQRVVPHLTHDRTFDFQARPNRIPLLRDAAELRALKPLLIVRSPSHFRWVYWLLVAAYVAGVYGLHLFWFRRSFGGSAALLPMVHLLTGLGLALMLSMQDPLRDTLLASGFVIGVIAGLALMGAVSLADFQAPFWRRKAAWWLATGVAVAAVLYLFGSGPTGSDAKVNLRLPVAGSMQPVELVKVLLVLFLASYFARNWEFLRSLKQRHGLPRVLRRLEVPRYRDVLPVGCGIAVALATFFLLQDMGPALVIGCTFLTLYGIARNRWLAVAAGFAVMIACFWIAYRTDAVPVVANRVAMLLSPWENFVVGGEHLAHAYWAMAAGGITGQGLGAGSPGYIPAAHTDMVLAAVGEEAGLFGVVAVLVLYGTFAVVSLRIALRAGGVFSFFLATGVTLLTLYQVILIAGGALGLVPLTGVVTPFLSYGKSSMMANGVLAGILMSVSAHPATDEQRRAFAAAFGRPVRYVAAGIALMLACVVAKAAYVQAVVADDWVLRPALVMRGDGARAYTYNPRIYEARRLLTPGTVYDRNGLPLATSRWDQITAHTQEYQDAGIDVATLDRAAPRYYPLGAAAFYLLGDLRTRVKWGADNSLYAEHRYLSRLRGFDNHPQPVEKRVRLAGTTEPIVRYNYAELLPLVRFGDRSAGGQRLLRKPRDVRLTVDARLQERVAEILREQAPAGKTASVVVLDAASGDVLASVTSPLPQAAYTDPSAAHADPQLFDRGYGKGAKPPGSTFKIVTAIAALTHDPHAASFTHLVHRTDRYARRGEPTGTIDLQEAIVRSSNVYFGALSHDVAGAEAMLKTMDLFGFRLGPPGLSEAERLQLLEQPDNLRQAGFGQGPVTGSPLQVARVAATIAAGGRCPAVRWIIEPAGDRPQAQYVLMPHEAQLLASFMRGVVTDRHGTGHVLHDLSIPVAGKSGTAEEKHWEERDGRRIRHTSNHAWFMGFAPYSASPDDHGRRIAFAVLVEDGGMGGSVAAPIAGAVVEAAAALGIIQP